MKHLVLITILLLLAYFGWQYTPSRNKFFVKEFLKRHAFKLIAIWVALWGGVFLAATNGSINIL